MLRLYLNLRAQARMGQLGAAALPKGSLDLRARLKSVNTCIMLEAKILVAVKFIESN